MPGKNGKGPTGKGQDQGQGQGVAGECLCPQCGKVTQHTAGIPCSDTKCPECGATMIRK